MKTPVLILLLLMLMPRLNAAPHALACAPALAAAGAVATAAAAGAAVSTDAQATPAGHHHGAHPGHDSMAAADVLEIAPAGHHYNHAAGQTDASTATASATGNTDCEHCNQCEQHCSAVLPTDLPRQLTHHSRDILLALTPHTLTGFASSLNRPPRTV